MLPYAVRALSWCCCAPAAPSTCSPSATTRPATLGCTRAGCACVVLAAASLATAAAVAVSGLIGFVGLVVPHIVRRLVGGSVPGRRCRSRCSAAGAFLVLADLVARTVVAPGELPIGVVTAFVGAPFFAALLDGWRSGLTSGTLLASAASGRRGRATAAGVGTRRRGRTRERLLGGALLEVRGSG